MSYTVGYVGTIEVETRETARIWISLTEEKTGADWIKIAGVRAWFSLNLESSERPMFMAELSLIQEAMRADLQIEVSHEGAASFHKTTDGDSYETNGVRILRAPLQFS